MDARSCKRSAGGGSKAPEREGCAVRMRCPALAMREGTILLLRACMALLAMPVHVLALVGLWQPFCRKVFFPSFCERFSVVYERKAKKQKQELFRNLPDFRSASGELNLLEIGTGCGTNFQFYPPGCKVTCTDINPGFQQSLLKNMGKNQHVSYERFLVAAGDALHEVPSASMDAVVCTLVLCSVPDVSSILKEVLRVLRPGPEGLSGIPCGKRIPWAVTERDRAETTARAALGRARSDPGRRFLFLGARGRRAVQLEALLAAGLLSHVEAGL
uniref:Methyltransferase like 7A n=1 Tax=Amazona collaria TaxID=241587 RepID=A0A8B9J0N9_9PSIT